MRKSRGINRSEEKESTPGRLLGPRAGVLGTYPASSLPTPGRILVEAVGCCPRHSGRRQSLPPSTRPHGHPYSPASAGCARWSLRTIAPDGGEELPPTR